MLSSESKELREFRSDYEVNKLLYASLIESNFSHALKLSVRSALTCPSEGVARLPGLLNPTAQSLRRAGDELSRADRQSVWTIGILSADYPKRFLALSDPPLIIFGHGNRKQLIEIDGMNSVGIVGTRRASAVGLRIARTFAFELAESQVSIVSGLALGIDTAAHSGAVAAKTQRPGSGIAVLGSGVLEIYPGQNQELVEKMLGTGGTVISEYGLNTTPRQHFFPERNRLIAALSDVVVVVEAGERSGALITSRLAAEIGREVLVVPASIENYEAKGSNRMLKDGVAPACSVEDVIAVLPRTIARSDKGERNGLPSRDRTKPLRTASARELSPVKQRILECLCARILTFDQIVDETALDPALANSTLSLLELDGWVERLDGDGFRRADSA